MTISDIDWHALRNCSEADLKISVFAIIKSASLEIQSRETDDPVILEMIPRLADLIEARPKELQKFRSLFSSLARSTGLWNYIETEWADADDSVIAEAVTAPELGGITFHREQINALNILLAGRNLILSAPTSFGKSLLIDALLATERFRRIAIVLPTIALLDETRRRFRERFIDKFNVIMHQSDTSSDSPTIFLGTQERLLYRDDLGDLDLTIVDEFYKLDPARRDERNVALNAAVYRLLKRSKQFFFLGPNIENVHTTSDSRWRFEFLRTRFSTVAVDTLDLRKIKNKHERLIEEIGEDKNWPALVFVSSPGKANKLAQELSQQMAVAEETTDFAEWLREYIGPKNYLSESLEYGFGIHHGRIPRAIANHMVRLFNDKQIPVLLCTSTLIEGINTSAKTIMIYDKTINRRKYDFFTFSNIKGRAGRLGQHYIGKVIIFNDTPEEEKLKVEPTIFSEDSDFPDEYIVHLDEQDRTERSDDRIEFYSHHLGLQGEDLKLASAVGFDASFQIKEAVEKSILKSKNLFWVNQPKWSEILEVCEVICAGTPASRFGFYNQKQLTTVINILRSSKYMSHFIVGQDEKYQGKEEDRDNIFKFLRACEYGLPQNFLLVEKFVNQNLPIADYSYFVGQLSSWFRPEVLKELDEEGVPIQISERYYVDGDTKASLRTRLRGASKSLISDLSNFERDWLRRAL